MGKSYSWVSTVSILLGVTASIVLLFMGNLVPDAVNLFFLLFGIPLTGIFSIIALCRKDEKKRLAIISLCQTIILVIVVVVGQVPFIAFVLLFSVGWYLWRKHQHTASNVKFNKYREIVMTVLFLYLLAVFYLTFKPFHFSVPNMNSLPLYWQPFEQISEQFARNTRLALYYVVGNIALTIPLGCIIPLLISKQRSWWKMLIYGLAFSLLIESAQLLFTERSAEVDDLIFNTGGALIGYLLFRIFHYIMHRIPRLRKAVRQVEHGAAN